MVAFNSVVPARRVDSARGMGWWTDAWALFMKNPGIWIVFALAMMGMFVLLALIPVIGHLAASLLAPVIVGGWLLSMRKSESGDRSEFADLFACFTDNEKLTPLLIIGACILVASLVIGLVTAALGMGALMGGAGSALLGSSVGVAAGMVGSLLAILVAAILGAVVGAAMWFAPALVVFQKIAPIEALKASINATLQNLMPFLVFGVIYLIAAALATLLFGLGWILLVPLSMLAMYVSYKDVFGN
jgi:hypothetical protein